jgi:hypothetical protein
VSIRPIVARGYDMISIHPSIVPGRTPREKRSFLEYLLLYLDSTLTPQKAKITMNARQIFLRPNFSFRLNF